MTDWRTLDGSEGEIDMDAGMPEGTESGSALRDQLERAIAEANAAKALAREQVASKFNLDAKDLDGVALSELPTRAAEIAEAKKVQRQAIVKEELTKAGLGEDEIARVLAGREAASTASTEQSTPSFNGLAAVGQLGSVPSRPEPGSEAGVFGPSRIRAAYGD